MTNPKDMTEHQLYTMAKDIITREELGAEHLAFRGDRIYREIEKRNRMLIWNKACDDAISIAGSIKDVYENYPVNHTKIISINRIDFCNPKEMSQLIGIKPKDIHSVMEIIDEDFFCSKVKGDSMIDSYIHPNDTVIIEKTNTIEENSIVLVSVDGKYLIKRINYLHDGVNLVSDNPKYEPMYFPYGSVKPFGVIRFSIKAH